MMRALAGTGSGRRAVALGFGLGLAAIASAGEPAVAASAADVRRTVDLLAAGDYGGAQAQAARSGEPALITYAQWRSLKDGPDAGFATYREFLDRHPGWPDQARLQVRAEATLQSYADPSAMLRFFRDRQPRTEDGRLALLAALVTVGGAQSSEVAALTRTIWVEDDFGAADEGVFLNQYGQQLGSAQHAARLDRLLWEGRTGDAERMLGRVPPEARAVAVARIRLQRGAKTADAALSAVPASLRSDPGLVFDRMRWRKARNQAAGIEELLLAVASEARRPADWWAERQRAVRRAMDEGDHARAYRLAASNRLPDGSELAEAEWLAGWLALRFRRDPAAAVRHFERFSGVVATPISRARGAYWSGRALAAQGDAAGSALAYGRAAAHPTAFYGQLAAAELGRPVRFEDGLATPPDDRARAAARRQDMIQMTELLCGIGAHREATPLLRQLGTSAGTDQAKLELVYDLARRCARPDLVVVVAKAAVLNGAEPLPTFPVPDVASMLTPVAGRPDAGLILAVARQESQFDPKAVSKAGARGLMQLMPTTGRGVARTLGLPFDLEALNDDPDFNVQLGSWYLGRQLLRYDGSVPLAAAAYNAGPGRVDEWLRRFGDPRGKSVHDLVDWIELIPFSETRNYVQRVVEGQTVYATLLAQGGGRLVPLAGARQGTAAIRRAGDGS